MKPADKKREFIRLRAEGQSYSTISKALSISKSTCTAWAEELSGEVQQLQSERLQELFTEYGMAKEARIRRIGETLTQIDNALESADLTQVPTAQLLKYKLDYTKALREEYAQPTLPMEEASYKTTFAAYANLLQRLQSGTITEAQARTELTILEKMETEQGKIDDDIFCLSGSGITLPSADEEDTEDDLEEQI